ncbi:MAG: hypothetical protein ABIH00_00045 [Armatimonadota bacterium]
MKKIFLLILILLTAAPAVIFAGSTANQSVSFQVDSISEFAASGDPGTFSIDTAVAGSQPSEVTDTTTSYAITTNETNKKITAALNSAMPSNTTLKLTAAAPTGGSSQGELTLTSSALDLVTGISNVAESGKTLTYKFSATVVAGTISLSSKTVTLTLTDET